MTAWTDMERLQQRELTARFVSGWTRERFAGAPSATERDILTTMGAVLGGTLVPVAAVLDWRELQ